VLSIFEWAYVVAYVTFAIGLLSSVARFYSRALVLRSWGWDDTTSCLVLVKHDQLCDVFTVAYFPRSSVLFIKLFCSCF